MAWPRWTRHATRETAGSSRNWPTKASNPGTESGWCASCGPQQPTHGVDVTGEPLERGIASLEAHAEYTKGLGAGAFEPRPFLTWAAGMGGPALGVESAVLFDVHQLIPDGPPPWV